MIEFPEKYEPMECRPVLRERGPARYGVGVINAPGKVGMVAGPFTELYDALNFIPLGRKDYRIFHLDALDAFPLYRWNRRKDQWVRVPSRKRWAFHANSECFVIVRERDFDYEELDDLGPAITYRREELLELIKDNPRLVYLYNRNEKLDDVPW